ncbi:MAG: C39 family peptidase [Candidatus Choladocola sp.]|nr:C39 family peptidase [Candidatus Choladocola sp.]
MVRIDVPYIDQSEKYPTGCESVSAVMLLQFLGYSITVDEFIADCLDQRSFEQKGSELYGPDPEKYFCGSPYDENSFGCYAPVIRKALERAAGDRYTVIDETGTSTEQLLRDYIDRGMPVVYWACINMREPVTGPCWRLSDSGEIFTWISNEHCMLLVGYDEESYYFNDPYGNNGVIPYPRELTEARHHAQHQMAVALRKKQA